MCKSEIAAAGAPSRAAPARFLRRPSKMQVLADAMTSRAALIASLSGLFSGIRLSPFRPLLAGACCRGGKRELPSFTSRREDVSRRGHRAVAVVPMSDATVPVRRACPLATTRKARERRARCEADSAQGALDGNVGCRRQGISASRIRACTSGGPGKRFSSPELIPASE